MINKCSWIWTGKGYKVIGPNGNSIFLPAAGFRLYNHLSDDGTKGYYWSSSLGIVPIIGYYSCDACFLSIYSGQYYLVTNHRLYGQSIRPVHN